MKTLRLGKSDVVSSVMGLGCMGMSEFYGEHDDVQSLKTLERAYELGVTMLDTSNVYGKGHNEQLIGNFLKGRRDKITVASKFGVVRDPDGPEGSTYDRGLDNSPAYMRQCCEESLQRLGTDYIDLYYVHRLDPKIPVEDTMGAMADLVQEGKIRAIGLSEVQPDTLRRAQKIHPVAALQSEYSLWTREPEDGVLPTCKELGIAFVAYCPLGRGFFTGNMSRIDDKSGNDVRLASPRFSEENMKRNQVLINTLKDMADNKEAKPGQIALAWLLHRGQDIIPIPGTKRVKYIEENTGAAYVDLTNEDLDILDKAFPPNVAAGDRYDTTLSSLSEATQK